MFIVRKIGERDAGVWLGCLADTPLLPFDLLTIGILDPLLFPLKTSMIWVYLDSVGLLCADAIATFFDIRFRSILESKVRPCTTN